MSPVARRQGPGHTGKAVAVASVGVIVALGVAFLVANLVSRGDVEVRLGDDRFNAGQAENMAGRIAEDDIPLGFGDVATGARPIWVDHAGTTPESGWVAFGAFEPDRPECTVNWHADRDRYVSDCDDDVTFPRSGEGLREYDVVVEDGRVYVDLQEQPADE